MEPVKKASAPVQLLNDSFAPDLAGSVYQDVVRPSQSKPFKSAVCTQYVALSRSEESLAVASVQGSLGVSAVARKMRRHSGPRGGAARQDALAATDADANSNYGDYDAWVAKR